MAKTKETKENEITENFKPSQYKCDWVNNVFSAIENSKKIWEPSNEVQVAINATNGLAQFGMNNMLANIAMEDSKTNQFVSRKAIDDYNKFSGNRPGDKLNTEKRLDKGSHFTGILLFENPRATYKENDKEVINGKANVGERRIDSNGYAERDWNITMIIPADKVNIVPLIPQINNETKEIETYKENVLATNYKGEPITYSHDGEYKVHGETIKFKKGDQVIEHYKGSTIRIPDWKNSQKVATEKVKMEPRYKPEVDIPGKKNDSPRQKFIQLAANYIRGAETGNYKGQEKPSEKEFKEMKEFYLTHPNSLYNDFGYANTYAKGNKAQLEKMLNSYDSKIVNTKEEKNENHKSKGRK